MRELMAITLATGWPNVSWGAVGAEHSSCCKNDLHNGVVAGNPRTSFVRTDAPSMSSEESNCLVNNSSICARGPESRLAAALPIALKSTKDTPKSSHARLEPILSRITTFPETVSPKGRTNSQNPPLNPLLLTKLSVSSEAWTAIVGENDRIINDLISSEPSDFPSKAEPIDDLANCGVEDLRERECDEPDRIGKSAIVFERAVGEETVWDSDSSASKD